MGKKSKAPATPDYASLMKQDAANQKLVAQELTRSNRPTQIDASGNMMSWEEGPGGNWTQRVTLSPEAAARKGLLEQSFGWSLADLNQQGQFDPSSAGQLRDFADTTGGVGRFTNTAGDLSNTAFYNTAGEIGNFDRTQGDKVAADYYESIMGRARPEQQRETDALDSQLRLQGLQPGTEAYNRAMVNLKTSHGDVATQAGLQATQAGYNAARDIYNTNLGGQAQRYGQASDAYSRNLATQAQRFGQARDVFDANLAAQGQQFGQNLEAQQFNNAAQQQRYAQALQNYRMPFERAGEYANLLQAVPKPEFAGFGTSTGYAPADMTGAAQSAYENQMGKYNASQNKKSNTLGTVGAIGGSFIGGAYGNPTLGAAIGSRLSDERLKTDIKELSGKESLEKVLALGGYSFTWKANGRPDSGLMAQEVQEVMHNLVDDSTGVLMVNYTEVVALLVSAMGYLADELNRETV